MASRLHGVACFRSKLPLRPWLAAQHLGPAVGVGSAGGNSSRPDANAMPSSAINERGRHARMVSADDGGTCVISSGDLYCWGAPLGNEEFGVPFRLAPSGMRFDHVSRAGGHVCARTVDGQTWCAGKNSYGELGGPSVEKCGVGPFRDGTVEDHPCSQVLLRVPEMGPVVDVVAGVNRTCAILANGRVSCWGAHHEARAQPLQAALCAAGRRTEQRRPTCAWVFFSAVPYSPMGRCDAGVAIRRGSLGKEPPTIASEMQLST